jgi:hypothetical protein
VDKKWTSVDVLIKRDGALERRLSAQRQSLAGERRVQ